MSVDSERGRARDDGRLRKMRVARRDKRLERTSRKNQETLLDVKTSGRRGVDDVELYDEEPFNKRHATSTPPPAPLANGLEIFHH